jgi:hypothetical protein
VDSEKSATVVPFLIEMRYPKPFAKTYIHNGLILNRIEVD